MEPHADMGCVLEVNVHCDACKMKMMEILSSICGVYSVTINAEEGTATVKGEVDPNILLRALSRSGKHAKVVWVKLNHPLASRNSNYWDNDYYSYNNYGSYAIGGGYMNHHGGVEDHHPYMYRRGLPVPERSTSRFDSRQCYPIRRSAAPLPQYPCYGGSNNYNYGSVPNYARHRNHFA